MEIQSKGSEVIISFKSSKVYIERDDKGYMNIKVTSGEDKSFEFNKPGEYGFGNLNFIALENGVDVFTSKLNLLLISTNSNVNVLAKFDDLEIDKSCMHRISGVNVLTSDLRNVKSIVSIVKKFEPESLTLVKSKDNQDASDLKQLQDIGVVEETEKLKLEESTFNHAEDVATKVFVLNTK